MGINKIERLKAEKDGIDVKEDIYRYATLGPEAITDDDFERLKWYGIFYRRRTPGYFMMRIRISNGITNASQISGLAEIVNRFGQGLADITTRQQIELRYIQIQDVPTIFEILESVGLNSVQTGMDNIRNVVGCPVAGLNARELLDASPVARQFTAMFVGNREFTNLPRKFNVTITGCRDNCVHAATQDIALVPATKDGAVGFNVLVGGKLGSGGYRIAAPLDVFVPPEEAAELCAAITLIFRDYGSREARSKVRLAFLLDERGEAWLRETLEARLGRKLHSAGHDERSDTTSDHIGVHSQKQPGLSFVGLSVPVGRITGDQLIEAGRLAEAYGTGEVRLTVGQNLIIPNDPTERVGSLLREPLLHTFRPWPSEIMRGLVSCTGIDYCNLALIDSKNRALESAQELERRFPNVGPITIHWSGCSSGCGNHQVGDIGLEGKRIRRGEEVIEAVDIYMGGSSGKDARLATKIMEDVPCDELPEVLEGLLQKRAPLIATPASPSAAPVPAGVR